MEGKAVEPSLLQKIGSRQPLPNAPFHEPRDARGIAILVEVRIERKLESAQDEKRGFVARVVGAVAVMELRGRKPPRGVADELPQPQGSSARSVSR